MAKFWGKMLLFNVLSQVLHSYLDLSPETQLINLYVHSRCECGLSIVQSQLNNLRFTRWVQIIK